jgi:light-regulated signal transduction histidine kinase (bacteriophytochrome)
VREHAAHLESANRDLESFAHSVSHDLKAPLRAIRGYSQMLLEDGAKLLPESDQELLRRIESSACQMSALIEGLLHLSQLGRQSLRKQSFDLSALVNEVVEELRRDLGARSVEVRLGQLENCVGDSALLKQVFVNLLANAFKFTRARERAVVEVGSRKLEGETVYFVRDNGAGFDMNYAENLFGVFQRLHSSAEFEGSGIGLSIVQRIVQRHSGRIWAEAEVDKGATFSFTLGA